MFFYSGAASWTVDLNCWQVDLWIFIQQLLHLLEIEFVGFTLDVAIEFLH